MIGQPGRLRRYPVKSLPGEELTAVAVTDAGLTGDRRLALVHRSAAGELRRLRAGPPADHRDPRPVGRRRTDRRGNPIRYRPNLIVDTAGDGFEENDWIGRELRVGPELVLRLIAPTPRCARRPG